MIFRKLLWLPRMDEYTMVVNDDGEEVPGILFNLELITASDVSDPVRCFRVEKKISDYATRINKVCRRPATPAGRCARLPEAERPPPLLLHNGCGGLRASTLDTCGANRRIALLPWFLAAYRMSVCHAVLFPECVTKGSRFLGVWGLDPCSPPVGRRDVFRDVFASFFASFSRRKFRVYGESCKTSIVLMRSRRRVYGVSCKTSVSASPLASPCLRGKLQNLSLCFSSGVAVSLGKAAKPPCLLVLCRRRVYGGSCKTVRFAALTSPCLWGKLQNIVLASPCLWRKLQTFVCLSSGVAVSLGEAAKPRSSVAVSIGEAANLRLCLSSGVAVSLGKATKFRWFWFADVAVSMGEACSTQYYTGNDFAQAL